MFKQKHLINRTYQMKRRRPKPACCETNVVATPRGCIYYSSQKNKETCIFQILIKQQISLFEYNFTYLPHIFITIRTRKIQRVI